MAVKKAKAARTPRNAGRAANSTFAIRYAGALEGCHCVVQRTGELEQWVGCQRAACLAQTKTQRQQRLRFERFQHSAVRMLRGTMPEDQSVTGAGSQSRQGKRRDADDESIDQHHR